jgi:hypothetical protein
MKRFCVIDGQGGGIGALIVKKLRERFGETVEILAIGTNAIATSQMMKSGANRGATGENPVVRTVGEVDLILGPVAVMWPNAMLGELTLAMAEAIASSPAAKILIPLHQEKVVIVGASKEPLPHLVDMVISKHLKEVLNDV